MLDFENGGSENKADSAPTEEDILKKKYGKLYLVSLTLEPDDNTEVELDYHFTKPATASYDRYVKTMSNSMTKASKAFILDNVINEDEERLKSDLEEYPALALSVSEKLLSMLGISKTTNLRLL